MRVVLVVSIARSNAHHTPQPWEDEKETRKARDGKSKNDRFGRQG